MLLILFFGINIKKCLNNKIDRFKTTSKLDFSSKNPNENIEKEIVKTTEKPLTTLLLNPRKIAAIDRIPVIG